MQVRVAQPFGVLLTAKEIEQLNNKRLQATAAKNTDTDFFEKAFYTYYEGLHRYAYTMLKDNEAAKDAVQHVFANVWAKRETVQQQGAFKSYLYRSVHNYCINTKLRGRPTEMLPPEDRMPVTNPDFIAEAKALQQQVLATIEQLPLQCKQVFLKSREEEKPYKAIAEELGISIKTVEAHMGKALKILRRELASFIHLLLLSFINYYNQL